MRNQGDKATGHTAMVLEALWKADHPLTNAEISDATGIPSSTVGKILYNQRNKIPCPIDRTEVSRKTRRGTINVAAHILTPEAREIWDETRQEESAPTSEDGTPSKQGESAPEQTGQTVPAPESAPANKPAAMPIADAEAHILKTTQEAPASISSLAEDMGLTEGVVRSIAENLREKGRVVIERIMNHEVVAISEQREPSDEGAQGMASLSEVADRINKELGGQTLPMSTIFRRIGDSDRPAVSAAIKELMDSGLVEVDNSKAAPRYRILRERAPQKPLPKARKEGSKKAAAGGGRTPGGAQAEQPRRQKTGRGKAAAPSAGEAMPHVSASAQQTGPGASSAAKGKEASPAPSGVTERKQPTVVPEPRPEPAQASAADEQPRAVILGADLLSGLTDVLESVHKMEASLRDSQGARQGEKMRQMVDYMDELERENKFWRGFAETLIRQMEAYHKEFPGN